MLKWGAAASRNINFTGEISEGWLEIAEASMKNTPMGQNDRLVAELMRFAPVPEVLIGEWIPEVSRRTCKSGS